MQEIYPNPRKTGRTTKLLETLPQDPTEFFYLVGYNQSSASNMKSIVRKMRGNDYTDRFVQARSVENISQWGRGIWHDKFYFDHTVWDNFSELKKDDQTFMMMIGTEIQIGKFFAVKPDKKETLWKRIRKKIASWIMPS